MAVVLDVVFPGLTRGEYDPLKAKVDCVEHPRLAGSPMSCGGKRTTATASTSGSPSRHGRHSAETEWGRRLRS
jgi:hypothetical protein